MKLFTYLGVWLLAVRERAREDRGDVPGWVMVTVMTAILVVAILAVFEPQIKDAVSSAISSVTGSK
jgi:hypothetical protein